MTRKSGSKLIVETAIEELVQFDRVRRAEDDRQRCVFSCFHNTESHSIPAYF